MNNRANPYRRAGGSHRRRARGSVFAVRMGALIVTIGLIALIFFIIVGVI